MTHASLSHLTRPMFGVRDNELVIGGHTVTELTRRVGRTPYYVYDRAVIEARLAALRAVLPRDLHLHYAVKANPMPDVVRVIAPKVDGLDVASEREMHVALATGMRPELISFAGPGKSDAELAAAARAGIVINVESTREIRVLSQLAAKLPNKPRIAIRVNPDFELKTSGMKMSGGPKQFGIDAEMVPDVLRSLAGLPLEFVGFHIFSGSQNLSAAAIIDAQQKAYALACTLAAHAPSPVRSLNLGGGFGIPYFPGDQPLELDSIGENLAALVARARNDFPQATLMIELGRYIIGEAGAYVCRVVDRKVSRGQVFLITDGGLHHHLAASGNFGQVIRKNYPVVIGNRIDAPQREKASVVGPLCTPLDLLGDRMDLAPAQEGDLVVVLQSGAYGPTASPIGFLSHPAPEELLV